MYKNYYLEVKNVADQIRAAPTEDPIQENDTEGFMKPRAPAEIDMESLPFEKVLMKYMQGVRSASPTARYQDALPPEADLPKGDLDKALQALGQIESSGNYQAVGPVVAKGAYKGDRAYGKYQVMGKNIPQWSKEVLGREITIDEFLSNTRYQDMIAGAKMANSFAKYGSWEDAASVWFSGRPLAKAGNASDGYNTVPEYVSKFRKAYA